MTKDERRKINRLQAWILGPMNQEIKELADKLRQKKYAYARLQAQFNDVLGEESSVLPYDVDITQTDKIVLERIFTNKYFVQDLFGDD